MPIRNFNEAEQFLFGSIPKASTRLFPGELGLERTKFLLRLLSNPQEKVRIVHIAGTSGKGSTAYLISIMLQSLRFKVGLHLSPHLIDIRERVQINNAFVSKEKFVANLNAILPAIQKTARSRFGSPTYFEILVALAFFTFAKERVDYAVMETGLGGLFDATNAVRSRLKLAVFTKIGFDHARILGVTLGAIAFQKAGVIGFGNTVISIEQKSLVRNVLERAARRAKTRVSYVQYSKDYRGISIDMRGTRFSFRGRDIRLGLIGAHQAENCALALAAVGYLAARDKFALDERVVERALERARFVGRFDVRRIRGKTVIFDGAHNPQKMHAFIDTLRALYPRKKISFLLAFKKGKDWKRMLKEIIPIARNITLTSFFVANQDWAHRSEDPARIAAFLKSLNIKHIEISEDVKKAFKTTLRNSPSPLVVTGSLYLLGEVYERADLRY